MPKTREPIVWHEAKNGMYLECPYDKEFMEAFKIAIPKKERHWNRAKRQWWVSDIYLDEVENLLFDHFERHGTGRD